MAACRCFSCPSRPSPISLPAGSWPGFEIHLVVQDPVATPSFLLLPRSSIESERSNGFRMSSGSVDPEAGPASAGWECGADCVPRHGPERRKRVRPLTGGQAASDEWNRSETTVVEIRTSVVVNNVCFAPAVLERWWMRNRGDAWIFFGQLHQIESVVLATTHAILEIYSIHVLDICMYVSSTITSTDE